MKLCLIVNLFICGLFSATGFAGEAVSGPPEGWVTDFAAAKASAKKENKDMLLDFTGSDWCSWCIKLKEEVFDQPSFKTFASKELVLVEVDFPHDKKLDSKVEEQNKVLQEKWKVQGFPTIILADAEGLPYARTGYQEGGPEKYIEHIKTLRAQKTTRDELLKKAATLNGSEKAKAFDQVIEAMVKNGVGDAYEGYIQQIIDLDKDNSAGLKGKYEGRKRYLEILNLLNSEKQGDAKGNAALIDKALTMADALLKDKSIDAQMRQEVHFLRANLLHTKQDAVETLKALEEAFAAEPKSEHATQIKAIIESLKSENAAKKEDEKKPVKESK